MLVNMPLMPFTESANSDSMSVTLETSQREMASGWLKVLAPKNVFSRAHTELVSQSSGALKATAL